MLRDDDLKKLKCRLDSCDLCPRKCGVNRNNGETGFCGNTAEPAIYQNFMHLGEEILLVPAFIVNMSGCSLSCPACSERCHFFSKSLPVGTPAKYAEALAKHLRAKKPVTMEWIGGEPSVQLPYVLETSALLKEQLEDCPPILLNTNGYFDPSLLYDMIGIIDNFVFDLKCSPACQRELTGVDDYWDVVTKNMLTVHDRFPGDHIVRHLVMPGHAECCTRVVLNWCSQNVPEMIVNLMTEFQDFRAGAEHPILPLDDRCRALIMAQDIPFKRLMVDGNWASF